jgi:hypothetical protein
MAGQELLVPLLLVVITIALFRLVGHVSQVYRGIARSHELLQGLYYKVERTDSSVHNAAELVGSRIDEARTLLKEVGDEIERAGGSASWIGSREASR